MWKKIVLEHPNRQKYIEISNDNKNIKRKEDSDFQKNIINYLNKEINNK